MNFFFNDADEIIPGLWIGNRDAAHNKEFLKKNNITVIVNCTKDIPFIRDPGISFYRIAVDDSLLDEDIQKMERELPDVLEFLIYTYSQNNRNILIHCYAGIQRSVIVTVSFLYILKMTYYYKVDEEIDKEQVAKEIIEEVVRKRPQAFFGGRYINFKKSFENYFGVKME